MPAGRVLVTGATGFVGRGLAADLAAAGRATTLAVRNEVLADAPGARIVPVGDIGGRTDWREALAGVDAVVHLAAHVHVAPERAEAEAGIFDEVNHLGAARLFEAASAAGIRLFVLLSSITVLGTATAGRPFDDLSETDPDGPYARSKLSAEFALTRAAESGSTRLVILRPPLVCGPGVGGNLASLARLARLPVPLPLGGARNRRTLLARDNLVSAIRRVLDAPEPAAGRFVLGDSAPLSTADIVRRLREGFGMRPGLVAVPPRLLELAAVALGRRGAYRRLFGDLEVDSSGFRAAYGWGDAVDTAESLRQTARHLVRDVPGRP